jgi:hypothetical protein
MKIKEEFDNSSKSGGGGFSSFKRRDQDRDGNHGSGNGKGGGVRNTKRIRGGGDNNKEKKKESSHKSDGRKNTTDGKGKKFSDVDANKPCPIPWHYKEHTWYKCFDNPDGPNYKPERAQQQYQQYQDQHHFHQQIKCHGSVIQLVHTIWTSTCKKDPLCRQ